MKIKAEYKDRVVTYTTAMGVPVSKKLGDLNTQDKHFLKMAGYNFDGMVEEPKKRKPKKYEGINEENKEDE